MDADWMYASYHYSHPILPERLGALGWKQKRERRRSSSVHESRKTERQSSQAAVGNVPVASGRES